MKKFEKFLFFYSILIITVIFVTFGIMSPKPLNFIGGVTLLPIVFYFWIRLTSPQAVGVNKWSIRFLLILIILSALGIYGVYLSKSNEVSPLEKSLKKELSEAQKRNEELMIKLEKESSKSASLELKKEIKGDVEEESIADLLIESSPAPGSVQKITSKSGINSIDVYQSPDDTSKKIGGLEPKLKYPYLEKSSGWYKVVVTSKTSGWVNSSQVYEVY